MFKLIGDRYMDVKKFEKVSAYIYWSDAPLSFHVGYVYNGKYQESYYATFEEAVVVFTQLLEAIGVPQEQIEKHIEESRQKIAEDAKND